ncbi:M24 family metallopeptidase [Calycomorphotria hydatis]|uniref:Putative peptidase n=1 Tax=Calycomorphotria hydatis TaxID=2528027 RepID=A0A517T9B9_9PLAN|nr:Xaa-Pro peptidase family protein [Calycomorphotria hydatis]QDT64970.1 putative peptidase [Calycomorphotria hydatis]
MLTKAGCERRRERFWEQMPDEVEWALIADPRSVLYFSNFLVQPLSFSYGERGLLLLERGGTATLLADNFSFRSAACEPYIDREVITTWYDHKHSVINRDHAMQKSVAEIASELTGKTGVVEKEWLPVGCLELLGDAKLASSIDVGCVVRELRRKKEEDEVAAMRVCMAAGNAGHARAKEFIAPGVSEVDVYREVQAAVVSEAGQAAMVYGDFRANNAESPKAGGLPTGYVMKNGDLFILDYSVIIDGYRSDFTNTYAVGEPTARQQECFDACFAGLNAGAAFLKAGVSAADVYKTVSKPLEDAGLGALAHHAGHGLGMAHPEPPILVPESTDTLIEGDVVTLEPGVYVEGVGGMRIEHNYLITADGSEQLSGHEIALV